MMRRRVRSAKVLLAIMVSVGAGCARDFEKELRAQQLAAIQTDAEAPWTEHSAGASSSPRGAIIPPEKWSSAIESVGPEEVDVRSDGVYLIISTSAWDAQILFVPCPNCPPVDLSNADPSQIREVSPRVYDLSHRW